MTPTAMRFGIFLAPFHTVDENPYLAVQRDFELVEWLDRLGYEEAWIGEHHSGGYEIIASPEIFIAGAAERTRHIRLGTGVLSVPYHHPLMVADRVMQLDHQLRGRFMFGMGPGALPSDAYMMGIDPIDQREMLEEGADVLVRLLSGEIVTHHAKWFQLSEARLQMPPFTQPRVDMAVASAVSPTGARIAGKHGIGLLSFAATAKEGFLSLPVNWGIAERRAAEHGTEVNREAWRLVGPMHVAETREQARENVRFGLEKFIWYFNEVAALPLTPKGEFDDLVDAINASSFGVIGTVEDAIRHIEALREQSGGFGCYLQIAHNWADFEQTKRSYELIARYVKPHFNQMNRMRDDSMNWAATNRPKFIGRAEEAIDRATAKHEQEQAAKGSKA
ncbi:MAG: LLM class flavin-dependent oxidoreductase [SAR324 cluster bacterium]|nr:LLM class flavin-dependent oxidoreductase [SAR324 cluster bacterium]